MKTIKNQSSLSPKFVTKILINRSRSGKIVRKSSMSIKSESGFFQSDSCLKNSIDAQNLTRPATRAEYPDYYEFYNAKRPRIKNVNAFLKIKSQDKSSSHDIKALNMGQNYSKTKQTWHKSPNIKFRQNNHKINQQSAESQSHRSNNSNNYLFKSKQQKLKAIKRDLTNKLRKKLSEIVKAEEKLMELKKSSELFDIIQTKMINKLKEIKNEQKIYLVDISGDSIAYLPQKSVLEDTSDSGSSKEIAEEYGLSVTYKF